WRAERPCGGRWRGRSGRGSSPSWACRASVGSSLRTYILIDQLLCIWKATSLPPGALPYVIKGERYSSLTCRPCDEVIAARQLGPRAELARPTPATSTIKIHAVVARHRTCRCLERDWQLVPQLLGVGDSLRWRSHCGPVNGLDQEHLLGPKDARPGHAEQHPGVREMRIDPDLPHRTPVLPLCLTPFDRLRNERHMLQVMPDLFPQNFDP